MTMTNVQKSMKNLLRSVIFVLKRFFSSHVEQSGWTKISLCSQAFELQMMQHSYTFHAAIFLEVESLWRSSDSIQIMNRYECDSKNVSRVERLDVLFNEVKPSWIEQIFQKNKYIYYCLNKTINYLFYTTLFSMI